MKNILTVLKFEYKGFVSAKAFRVVTIIFVCSIIVVTSLPQIIGAFKAAGIGGGGGEKDKAALILSGEALTNEVYKAAFTPEALKALTGTEWVDLSAAPPSEAALAQAIQEGEYLFALRYSGGEKGDFFAAGNRMTSAAAAVPLEAYVGEAARQAQIALLPQDTQAEIGRITALKAQLTVIDIGGSAESNYWIGYILIMFLFYVIMGYTNYVTSSIVTEKTSKAMELLVTAVRPLHLMVGKVLGVGFASLTQVGCFVASAGVGLAINIPYWRATNSGLLTLLESAGLEVDVWVAVIVVVYFLLGFFLYAFFAAAFASTVTKPEEAATVTTLPITLMMVSLALGFFTLFGVGSKALIAGLSYVPFFTPIAMIARFTIGDAGPAQLLLGAAILAAAIVLVAMAAAKIFRMGVMLYGVKATPRQIWRALRSS